MSNSEGIFCLFVHVGRIRSEKADMLIMPLGLPMLAGVLEDNGYKSLVLNEAMRRISGGPSLEDTVRQLKPKLLAFSLHWHQQLPYVIAAIRKVRAAFPKIRISIGGFTSSYFAKEIMGLEGGPDFIIRGDGELPLLELARQLSSESPDFHKVPNLAWRNRENGEAVFNPQTYICDCAKMSELSYARYDLVLDKKIVMRGDFVSFPDCNGRFLLNSDKLSTVFYNPGRGCPYECSFCGGCENAQFQINSRRGYFFKSIESALNDIKGFKAQGFDLIHTCFDPDPSAEWYLELFAAIRKAEIKTAYVFEPWGLPSRDFQEAFAETFRECLSDCRITISPESGSEEVRRCNKGIFYSNDEMEEAVALGRSLGIPMEVSFMSSLPGEKAEDFMKSVQLAEYYTKKYNCEANMAAIGLEPGSPMYEHPEKYGIKTINNGFETFLENSEGKIDWEHENRPWGTSEKRKIYFNAKKPQRPYSQSLKEKKN